MATTTARQTLRPLTIGTGETIETASGWSQAMVPATWQHRGTLARPCGCAEPEAFAFYALPDGRVARVQFHPMNGPDALFVRVTSAATARADWAELLAGEPFAERTATYGGRVDVRRGRMRKAYRLA
jgi:hypothetical protein